VYARRLKRLLHTNPGPPFLMGVQSQGRVLISEVQKRETKGGKMNSSRKEMADLSQSDENRLMACELTIRSGVKAFCAVGDALCEIRDGKLYRTTHETFEAYCSERWQISKTHANRLIDQSVVVDAIGDAAGALTPIGVISEFAARQIKPHLAEVTQEIREKVAAGADPVTTTYEVIEAKRAEIKKDKEPDIEPEPENPEPDPWKELEFSYKENRDLQTLVDSLSKSDVAKELADWQQRYVQLEGRLGQQMTTANEAQNSAQYYANEIKKIRKALKVEKTTEILPRIQQLIAEARA